MGRRGNGEGSIRKRNDGRWQGRHIANGKRKYVYGKTRKEVTQKLTAAINEVNNGLFCEDRGITVRQHLGNWLITSRDSVGTTTWERYEQICRMHIVPDIGHLKLKNLTPMVIQNLYQRKMAVLSPRTVVYIHVTLHKALSQALNWNLIPKNVTELVDRPRIVKREIKPLTVDEVETLFATLKDHPLEALYVVSVTTGLRRGETLALQWKDVDLDSGVLQVRRSLSFTKGGPVFVPPKTAKGKRNIGLSSISIEALRKHKLLQENRKDSWVNSYDLLFPNNLGEPRRSRNVLNASLERIKKRGNLPDIRFHDLRHTCATLLLTKGVHPKIVQELLGHSSISITLDTYSHVLPNMQEKVVEAMEDIFE